MCGNYKLVVCVVIFEPGWGRCDLHTYTIDYGDVLQLVDDSSAAQGDIKLIFNQNFLVIINIPVFKSNSTDCLLNGNVR
mgnify:CR=1 FL=1